MAVGVGGECPGGRKEKDIFNSRTETIETPQGRIMVTLNSLTGVDGGESIKRIEARYKGHVSLYYSSSLHALCQLVNYSLENGRDPEDLGGYLLEISTGPSVVDKKYDHVHSPFDAIGKALIRRSMILRGRLAEDEHLRNILD
jgi:hypothetical protein